MAAVRCDKEKFSDGWIEKPLFFAFGLRPRTETRIIVRFFFFLAQGFLFETPPLTTTRITRAFPPFSKTTCYLFMIAIRHPASLLMDGPKEDLSVGPVGV